MSDEAKAIVPIDYVRSRKQTAEILGISLRTLQRMEAKGDIPPRIRVSERICGYRDSAINQFLASRVEGAR